MFIFFLGYKKWGLALSQHLSSFFTYNMPKMLFWNSPGCCCPFIKAPIIFWPGLFMMAPGKPKMFGTWRDMPKLLGTSGFGCWGLYCPSKEMFMLVNWKIKNEDFEYRWPSWRIRRGPKLRRLCCSLLRSFFKFFYVLLLLWLIWNWWRGTISENIYTKNFSRSLLGFIIDLC